MTLFSKIKPDREWGLFSLIYISLSISALILKIHQTSAWLDGTLFPSSARMGVTRYSSSAKPE